MSYQIGVIGFGYWGPNLVRNFLKSEKVVKVHIYDADPSRRALVNRQFPSVVVHDSMEDILRDDNIGIVAVATPVNTHYQLAKDVLLAGKHVLIEKPMAMSSTEAYELVNLAESRNLMIMVDHTFLFTGAVRKIKELVTKKELGDLIYYDSTRINLGLFQHDVNVIWDLAVHDIAIIKHLFPSRIKAVSCNGTCLKPFKLESLAFAALHFEDESIAFINVNWMSPVKVRLILVGGTKKMVVWDDVLPSEKVKIYDKSVEIIEDTKTIYETLVQYRVGDMYAPKIENVEALALEADYMVNCIEKGEKPFNDGVHGFEVVQVLEALNESLRRDGNTVKLPTE